MNRQQLIISGVGGQGILFVTRLLAETAIAAGMPVLTSETHGMAQRGGVVISHLKAGSFESPLVRPGRADGLLALHAGTLGQHLPFLRPGGWLAVNAPVPPEVAGVEVFSVDASKLALETGAPRGVNLILLGFALARLKERLFCNLDEATAALKAGLKDNKKLLTASLAALETGLKAGEETRC